MMKKEKLIEHYPPASNWLTDMPETYYEYCRLLIYQRGKTIFLSGDYLKAVYILCKGVVMISSSNIQGDEMNVVYIKEGTTLGEMETILELKRMKYSAGAFTDCTLLEIPYTIFKRWIEEDKNASRQLNRMFAEKLYHSSTNTIQYNHSNAETRLKLFFLNHGTGYIYETREELAKACGVNVRTIYRILSKLAKEGFITINKRKILLTELQMIRLQESLSDIN